VDELQQREMIEGLDQLATWTRHYYLRLIAEGFTSVEALALAQAWQRGVLQIGTQGGQS
jgi:hypothetical protein